MRPRVLIDGFFWGKSYGFGRVIGELCRALGTMANPQVEPVVAIPDSIDRESLPRYPSLVWQPVRSALFPVWEQLVIPLTARRLACDLIHFPYNTRAVFAAGRPAVVTVHDLLFLDEPVPWRRTKDAIYSLYSKVVFRIVGTRSAAVVAVSDTTSRALAARGVTARTIYNTVDGLIADCAAVEAARAPRPYILHRGGYAEHRNTAAVIAAFRAARPDLAETCLRVLGAPDGAAIWGTHHERDIKFLPHVSDAELAALYRGSLCVVAASLQEGFGLPLLEAFAFGAPVITSNREPMREVAGPAALLVDPTDVDAIASAMRALATKPDMRAALVARGKVRVRDFGSDRVAQEMMAVYSWAAQLRHSPAVVGNLGKPPRAREDSNS